jgi:hypothetical protein
MSQPFFLKKEAEGYLCIQLGAQRLFAASSLKVDIDGTAITFGTFANGPRSRKAVSTNLVKLASGAHQMFINVPPFVPKEHGESDLRALGLPLQSVSIVSGPSECGPAHSQ